MANGLENASFLDGAAGWTALTGACAVDETAYGAPGRAVLIGAGGLSGGAVAVVAGQTIEAYALVGDSAGGAVSATVKIGASTTVIPLSRAQNTPKRGLSSTFGYVYARFAAPVTGAASLHLTSANETLLLKPYLGVNPSAARTTVWDPGFHVAADLQLPVWPSDLPPFLADSLAAPVSNMVTFQTDTNIPLTTDLYAGLQYDLRPHMRVTLEQIDVLDQFWDANRGTFFVVEPLSERLCIASWLADGQPKPVSTAGFFTIVEVGLHMAVS